MKVARMTIEELLSVQLLKASAGTNDFLGFGSGIGSGDTYGGINSDDWTAWSGTVIANFGAITLPGFKEVMGQVTYGTEKPDLAITTQAVYDALWAQVQPQQRFLSPNSTLAKIGFTGIEIDGCQVLADRNCPNGTLYMVNTNYWKLVLHKNKAFYWTPKKDIPNADVYVRQLLVKGNFFTTSRRMNAKLTGVTA